jgi:hypothetical protein
MKKAPLLLFAVAIVLADCGTITHVSQLDNRKDSIYPVQGIDLCGARYSFTGGIHWKHRIPHYRLTIVPPGLPAHTIELGAIPDFEPKASLFATLKQTLHNSDLWVPCNGQNGQNYVALSELAEALIAQPFPYTKDKEIATEVLDDNNVLRILQEASSKRYQLVDITPAGSVVLLDYNTGNTRYELATGSLTAFIIRHFDGFLKLYFKLPPTTVRPLLFVVPNGAPPNGYELILQNPEGNPDYLRTNIIIPTNVASKNIADPDPGDPGVDVPNLGHVQLRKMTDPNGHPKPPVQNPPIPHENP